MIGWNIFFLRLLVFHVDPPFGEKFVGTGVAHARGDPAVIVKLSEPVHRLACLLEAV